MERRGRLHRERKWQQDGDSVRPAQAGQGADDHTDHDSDRHEADVVPGQRNAKAVQERSQLIQRFVVALRGTPRPPSAE